MKFTKRYLPMQSLTKERKHIQLEKEVQDYAKTQRTVTMIWTDPSFLRGSTAYANYLVDSTSIKHDFPEIDRLFQKHPYNDE